MICKSSLKQLPERVVRYVLHDVLCGDKTSVWPKEIGWSEQAYSIRE